MIAIKTLTATAVAALTLAAAGVASAQTPYSQTPYGQQTQSDPIGAILGALFGDRMGASTTLDSEWSRGRRPLGAQSSQFQTRLDADVRSGAISSEAARSLNTEYGALVQLEARYAADGRITNQERADLTERYRAFSTRYQSGGQGYGDGYDNNDRYDAWRPIVESRASFDARVNAAVRSRDLTRAQASRLTSDFNALVQLESSYARNGIDARERQDLEARWADLNRRVGDDWRDGNDTGYDAGYGQDGRAVALDARITASERSGRLSRAEAARLREELRDLSRRWVELEARVDVRR